MILVLHGLDNASGVDAAASLGLTQATLGRAETKTVREWLLKLSEEKI